MTKLVPPPLFAEWKRCLFQRPLELCSIYNENVEGFIDQVERYEFRATRDETLALFTYSLRNMTTFVSDCSPEQIAYGLNHIFNGTYSNMCHDLLASAGKPEQRIDASEAIYALYKDYLANACRPGLGHRNESETEIETFTYMLWDVSPLSQWIEPKGGSPLLSVLERVLYIPHDGCIESALHGLGHSVYRRQDAVIPTIIDRFLAAAPDLRPELRAYALAARTGMIQ